MCLPDASQALGSSGRSAATNFWAPLEEMAAAFSWTLLSWYEWPMRRVPGEKYQSELGFRLAQLRRLPIRSAISRLVRWKPLEHPRDGYTIVIGCNTGLARMLGSNLKFLSKQNLLHLAQVFVVLDRPRASIPDDIEPVMRARFPKLPLEFLYYNRVQRAVCSTIRSASSSISSPVSRRAWTVTPSGAWWRAWPVAGPNAAASRRPCGSARRSCPTVVPRRRGSWRSC